MLLAYKRGDQGHVFMPHLACTSLQVAEWQEHNSRWRRHTQYVVSIKYLKIAENLIKKMNILLDYMGKEEDQWAELCKQGQALSPGQTFAPGEGLTFQNKNSQLP
jgi:hypothetical protein